MADWVIVVDDDEMNLKMAGNILSRAHMRVTAIKSGEALIDYISKNNIPDLILLDVKMPGMDGFETFKTLRKTRFGKNIPIIFLTADESEATEAKGLLLGATDFIRKPFNADVLVSRVNGTIKTQKKMRDFEIEATIDKLTGFYNKNAADEKITKMCVEKSGALMIVDLDSFKLVNDIYGHEMGDRVLNSFSNVLRDNLDYPAVFGRFGGDEFLIFAENLQDEKDIAIYAEAVNSEIMSQAHELMGSGMSIPLGASFGVVFVDKHDADYNELFNLCDRALYTTKNTGKHGYTIYKDENDEYIIAEDESLSMFSKILEERNIPRNAMWMGGEAFGNIYKYMIRYMERYRGTAYKMLFTAKFIPKKLSKSEKEKILLVLRKLLQESLRNSDIMMQIGENHFFLMLPEINDYNIERVIQRIMQAWENNEYGRLAKLEVETESISHWSNDKYNEEKKDDSIVIAYDDSLNLDFVKEVLVEKGYNVTVVKGGGELCGYLKENMTDMIMIAGELNDINSIKVVEMIRDLGSAIRRIPIIIVSEDDSVFEKRMLELGVADFINIPISKEKIYIRVKNILRLSYLDKNLEQEIERKNEENEQLSMHIIKALAYAIDAKDRYTNGHSLRVAEYSRKIASRCGFSESEQNEIYIIGLLHDVGKIGIPDGIINKVSKLDDEEFKIIKNHPIIGTQILETITEMPALSKGARWHHERYDGKGYPDGLQGGDIPRVARIIAVADAYDAMTSNRSYRKPLSQEIVKEEIRKGIGTQFDPEFASVMIEMIDEDTDYEMRERNFET